MSEMLPLYVPRNLGKYFTVLLCLDSKSTFMIPVQEVMTETPIIVDEVAVKSATFVDKSQVALTQEKTLNSAWSGSRSNLERSKVADNAPHGIIIQEQYSKVLPLPSLFVITPLGDVRIWPGNEHLSTVWPSTSIP